MLNYKAAICHAMCATSVQRANSRCAVRHKSNLSHSYFQLLVLLLLLHLEADQSGLLLVPDCCCCPIPRCPTIYSYYAVAHSEDCGERGDVSMSAWLLL